MSALKEGGKAPAFSAKDQDGNPVKLADFKGKPVILYFYPKDMTSGCTTQACAFRDDYAKLTKKGAIVLGVSPDSSKSHQKFIEKHSLPFPLLVDEDHAIAEKYGAWGEKSMYGRKYFGIIRSTFLIDGDGKLKKIWSKVKVAGHNDEVFEAIESRRAAP